MGGMVGSARSGVVGLAASVRRRLVSVQERALTRKHPPEGLLERTGSAMPRLAVLVDAENVTLNTKDWQWLERQLQPYGTVNVRRAYAKWTGPAGGQQGVLHKAGFRLIHHASSTTAKNASDIVMAIDAIQVMHSGLVDGFCLVSKDADFTPLVTALRESNMSVYGCGDQHASHLLRAVCDKYFTLPSKTVAAKTTAPTRATAAPDRQGSTSVAMTANTNATQGTTTKSTAKKAPAKKTTVSATSDKDSAKGTPKIGDKASPSKKPTAEDPAFKKNATKKQMQDSQTASKNGPEAKKKTAKQKGKAITQSRNAGAQKRIPAQSGSPEQFIPPAGDNATWPIDYSRASDAYLVSFLRAAINETAGKTTTDPQHQDWVYIAQLGSTLATHKAKVESFERNSQHSRGLGKLIKTLPHHFELQKETKNSKPTKVRCLPMSTPTDEMSSGRTIVDVTDHHKAHAAHQASQESAGD